MTKVKHEVILQLRSFNFSHNGGKRRIGVATLCIPKRAILHKALTPSSPPSQIPDFRQKPSDLAHHRLEYTLTNKQLKTTIEQANWPTSLQ